MLEFNLDKMLFNIPADAHEKSDLTRILKDHPEVQFVSFAGLDIAGNDTDERIPIKLFIEDMDVKVIPVQEDSGFHIRSGW